MIVAVLIPPPTEEEFDDLVRLRWSLAGHRWPWEPLGDVLGGSVRSQAAQLGVHDRQVSRWRSYGLTDDQADRFAILVNSHPAILWPDWDALAA